jgi:hypothetical protein
LRVCIGGSAMQGQTTRGASDAGVCVTPTRAWVAALLAACARSCAAAAALAGLVSLTCGALEQLPKAASAVWLLCRWGGPATSGPWAASCTRWCTARRPSGTTYRRDTARAAVTSLTCNYQRRSLRECAVRPCRSPRPRGRPQQARQARPSASQPPPAPSPPKQPPALHPEDARHHRPGAPHLLPPPAQRRPGGRHPPLPGPQPAHAHHHAGGGCRRRRVRGRRALGGAGGSQGGEGSDQGG